MYEAQNHALSLAMRDNSSLAIFDAGYQKIPYQGFPNQWMDMTGNEAWFMNGRYETKLDWGKLYLQAFYQHTAHEMEFLERQEDWTYGSSEKNAQHADAHGRRERGLQNQGRNSRFGFKHAACGQ